MSPGQCQPTIWPNADILSTGPFGTTSVSVKINLRMPSAKWRPFCPGLNMVTGVLVLDSNLSYTVIVTHEYRTQTPINSIRFQFQIACCHPHVYRYGSNVQAFLVAYNWAVVTCAKLRNIWWQRIKLHKEKLNLTSNWKLIWGSDSSPSYIVQCDGAVHDDFVTWKYIPRYWPFVRGIHRSPVDSPHEGQWRWTLMFSLMCAWTNGWANNRDASDLRRHRSHYDATVMSVAFLPSGK